MCTSARSAYTPTACTVPHLRVRRTARSNAWGWPTASTHTSTPRPAVSLAHHRPRVALLQVHRVRPEGLGHREALGHRVHRHHLRGAARARGLHRAEPHRPQTQYRDSVSRMQPASPRSRDSPCPSHRPRTAPSRRSCPRARGAARDRRWERAPARPGCPAASRAPRRGRTCARSRTCERGPDGRRSSARRRSGNSPAHDRRPRLVHVIARGKHRADVLVPDREARFDLHAAVVDVQIRAAHARRLDAHDRIARVEQLGLGDILHPHLVRCLEGDGTHR